MSTRSYAGFEGRFYYKHHDGYTLGRGLNLMLVNPEDGGGWVEQQEQEPVTLQEAKGSDAEYIYEWDSEIQQWRVLFFELSRDYLGWQSLGALSDVLERAGAWRLWPDPLKKVPLPEGVRESLEGGEELKFFQVCHLFSALREQAPYETEGFRVMLLRGDDSEHLVNKFFR